MKYCDRCKYAEWRRTKSGHLHPSKEGECHFEYKIPPLPQSRYFVFQFRVGGGMIKRGELLKDHCAYYCEEGRG
jgi:hypothetical protein